MAFSLPERDILLRCFRVELNTQKPTDTAMSTKNMTDPVKKENLSS